MTGQEQQPQSSLTTDVGEGLPGKGGHSTSLLHELLVPSVTTSEDEIAKLHL
jgi:hypothetical protein